MILSTERHGVSFWAKTGRINVVLDNGAQQSFFIKVLSGEQGSKMVRGEFESMNAIYKVVPEFVPKPIGWGTYQTIPDTHFFLCEFREMTDEMPDPNIFAASLSALHQKSESPTGMFGFDVTTYAGNLPQMVAWEKSWETFFAKSMRHALDLEIGARGYDKEFDVLVPALFDKVIPRLLRPLESEGRTIKPSLVHGDLWYANCGIDVSTSKPLVFDACCFYAHNECKQISPNMSKLGLAKLINVDMKMSLASGDQPAISLERNMSLHTDRLSKYQSLRKILKVVLIFIGCENANIPLPCLARFR